MLPLCAAPAVACRRGVLELRGLDETRAYIPRALALTWLYAAQLGLPAPSLDEIAAGGWPTFEERAPDMDLPRPARPSRGLVAQLR